MVLGVALGYEDLDIDTAFNNGTFDGKGYGITPYFGMSLSPQWSFQILGGYTTVEYDTTSNNGAVSSSFDASRVFGSAAVVGNFRLTKKVVVAPKLSILHLAESQDGTTDSRRRYHDGREYRPRPYQLRWNAELSRRQSDPFVRVMGEYDYTKEAAVDLGGGNFSSDDDVGINASVGLNMNFGNGVTGNVEATSATLLRENIDVYTFSGTYSLHLVGIGIRYR